MKLGFGLYKHMLNEEHYKFAKQCGATHLVVHLVDYFSHEKNNKNTASQPLGQKEAAVKRREQEQASAKNQFYEPHREEVRLSKERVRAEWRSWMDSWNSDRSEASGVRWRQDFERQLAEATARRG